MANGFDQGRGLVTASQLIIGDLTHENIDIEQSHDDMNRALGSNGLLAFSEVDVVRDFETGVLDAAQATTSIASEVSRAFVQLPPDGCFCLRPLSVHANRAMTRRRQVPRIAMETTRANSMGAKSHTRE